MDSLQDILARQNGSFRSSSSVHRTDLPSSLRTSPPSDGPTDRPKEGSEEEDRLNLGWISPCGDCGITEADHVCAVARRWEVVVPDDPLDLAHYLASVWGIRMAELVAIEVGAEAIRLALAIVRRGGQEGRRYAEPAGLIVKLARRISRANSQARRHH